MGLNLNRKLRITQPFQVEMQSGRCSVQFSRFPSQITDNHCFAQIARKGFKPDHFMDRFPNHFFLASTSLSFQSGPVVGLSFISPVPECTCSLTSLVVFTCLLPSCGTQMTLDKTQVTGRSEKRVTLLLDLC